MAITTKVPSGTDSSPSRSNPTPLAVALCGGVSKPDPRIRGGPMAQTTVEGIEGVLAKVGQHHGHLTLSLVSALSAQIIEAKGFRMGVNYGADKIRFMSPVPVGARIRASATLDDAKEFEGGVQMTLGITMEIENQSKPAMVAAILFRRYV